jgi:hypothetical protein
MGVMREEIEVDHLHDWLRTLHVSYVPGPETPLTAEVASGILEHFRAAGHHVQSDPNGDTDIILTTATFGEPVGWRTALMLSSRRRFGLHHSPTIYTLVHVTPEQLEATLDHFRRALSKEPPDPAEFAFPGMAPMAYRVLIEQGRRGGPIMAMERLVQSQTMSIHVLLLVGDSRPHFVYHFDLVGAHPRSMAGEPEAFYRDIVLRIVTVESTHEVTGHELVGQMISDSAWKDLPVPKAMKAAALELGQRQFFTEMVRVADLVQVPALHDAVAEQYSEGCFASWEPALDALVATVTGSARPVDKGKIGDDDLAVIVGVRPDGKGALVRHVEGKRNDPPSSEAVEMMEMDTRLPKIVLGPEWGKSCEVPVARSKLHGHRGVAAYDPRHVEFLPLDPPYYHYLVSCATEAQARGIKEAFARSTALNHPDDPRQLAFTVLPGHGVVIVEKWVRGKAPFQVMWEAMDSGRLEPANTIPQGPMDFVPGADGRMVLHAD